MSYYRNAQQYNQWNDLLNNMNLLPTNAINNRDELMNRIQTLVIERTNQNLFLDVFPDDQQTIQAFNDINSRLKAAVDEYESKYGPLSLDSPHLSGAPWKWLEAPWPWERQRGM